MPARGSKEDSVAERHWATAWRIAGLLLAVVSAAGATLVIRLLYTGRGGETPIRSAILEQPLVFLLGAGGLALGLYIAVLPENILAARPWLNPRRVWREHRPERFLLMGSCAIALVLLELGSRAIYAAQLGFPFFYPVEDIVYPPLYEQLHDYSDEGVKILLLGGSVLYFAGRENTLESAFEPPARVYNLAQTAHSSHDSLTKYRYVLDRGYEFDYVIFYHGINDVRANNVPPELFSDDYTHYFFYRLTNTVFDDRNPALRCMLHSALVFRIERLVTQLRETRFFGRNLVHMAFPREDWLLYGADVKSRNVFEKNLLEIAGLADEHGSRLIVPRFASHPALADFAAGRQTGKTEQEMVRFAEQWGLPGHVAQGIQAHNEVIEMHSDRYSFVDTRALEEADHFVDPCHFTPKIQAEFLELLVDTLREVHTESLSGMTGDR